MIGRRREDTLNSSIPYLGEILSLLTAVLWAFAVILFKRSGETVHPIALNLFKNTLAVILFIPTMMLVGKTLFVDAPYTDYLLVLVSGALGIGISDTLFLKSLNMLGAGLSAIVDCLYSAFIITLSFICLGESLLLLQVLGALLIISAVLTVASREGSRHLSRSVLLWGIFWGTLAMLTNAVGIVMIKPLLDRSPLLWTVEFRLVGGMLVLAVVLLFRRDRGAVLRSLRTAGGMKYTVSGSFIGAYLAMMFWLGGMKFTQASIAAALNQTSTICIFIFAWWLLKEPINRTRILGVFLGVAGSLLVTFG